MSSRFFPDQHVASPSGNYLLTAMSPDNGAIPRRDGSKPTEKDFSFKYKEWQSSFRLQLIDRSNDVPVWTIWQSRNQPAPTELVAFDSGHALMFFEGHSGASIYVVAPDRFETIIHCDYGPSASFDEVGRSEKRVTYAMRSPVVGISTVGYLLNRAASHVTCTYVGRELIAIRVLQQAVVFDLSHRAASVVPNSELLPPAVIEAELKWAEDVLVKWVHLTRMDEGELVKVVKEMNKSERSSLGTLRTAIGLTGLHRNRRAIELLREYERMQLRAMSTSSTACGTVVYEQFTPIAKAALRRIGAVPAGYPSIRFEIGQRPVPITAPIERRDAALKRVGTEFGAVEILSTVGPPDRIERVSRKEGNLYVWPERWHYDMNDCVGSYTLHWEETLKPKRVWLERISYTDQPHDYELEIKSLIEGWGV